MKVTSLVALVVLALVLSINVPLVAQTSEGKILGTVQDPSGAVVVHAKVTITNTATGAARSIATTEAGEYAAPDLEPGPYVVVVEAPGFQKAQHSAVTLEVAKDVRIDFKLVAGAMSETMTISGEAPMVDTTSDVLGGTFSNEAINELPLLGRDFQNLAVLQPGIERIARRWIPVHQCQWESSGRQQLCGRRC